MRPDITKSKNVWTYILAYKSKIICCYIDLNFSVCKIIEFTLKSLKEMLKALGLSQVVNKRKPTEAFRNGDRSSKPHYSLEALTSPNTTEASTAKNFY